MNYCRARILKGEDLSGDSGSMNSFWVSGLAFLPWPASSRSCSFTPTFFCPHAAGHAPGSRHRPWNERHQIDRFQPIRDQRRLDPRLRADQQTGEAVYTGNHIDQGHLVRRTSASGATPGPTLPRPMQARSTTRDQIWDRLCVSQLGGLPAALSFPPPRLWSPEQISGRTHGDSPQVISAASR